MKKTKDSLGDRMKTYENISRIYLTKRSPVIIRIDGKAFHTFTRGFAKPFDKFFMMAMQETAKHLCKEIAGCKLAYVQSDEISLLLTDYDTIGTQPWFENNLQKLVSVSASIVTLAFNRAFASLTRDLSDEYAYHGVTMRNLWGERTEKNFDAYTTAYCRGATFDARAFILPKEEVCNYFIWRQQDATRNSILAVAQSVLSHKEMQSKKCTELQDILFAQKGINWNHFPTIEKRGACIVKATVNKNGAERREWVVDPDIPIFTQDKKYIDKFVYLNSEATNG